jgi:hypothetical protein
VRCSGRDSTRWFAYYVGHALRGRHTCRSSVVGRSVRNKYPPRADRGRASQIDLSASRSVRQHLRSRRSAVAAPADLWVSRARPERAGQCAGMSHETRRLRDRLPVSPRLRTSPAGPLRSPPLRLEPLLARLGPEEPAAVRAPPSSARELFCAYVRRFASRTSWAHNNRTSGARKTREAPLAWASVRECPRRDGSVEGVSVGETTLITAQGSAARS